MMSPGAGVSCNQFGLEPGSKKNYESARGYAERRLIHPMLAGLSACELKLEDSRHADETGERVGPHLDHYVFSVSLDRTLRGSQLGSHLLVQQTPSDQSENLAFPRGELSEPTFELDPLGMLGEPFTRQFGATNYRAY